MLRGCNLLNLLKELHFSRRTMAGWDIQMKLSGECVNRELSTVGDGRGWLPASSSKDTFPDELFLQRLS